MGILKKEKKKEKNWTRQIIKYYENDMKIGKVWKQHNVVSDLNVCLLNVVYWKGCFYWFYELEQKKGRNKTFITPIWMLCV